MPRPLAALNEKELAELTAGTIAHYDAHAEAFWTGTKDHDVGQNIEAFLRHLPKEPPLAILDLGCGPGRDLMAFAARGHLPIGLDASRELAEMARAHSGCEVWQQNLLRLDLPERRFNGIFANAVLFHVPSQELPRVLLDLFVALEPGGVLFVSNPRGPDVEGAQGDRRYGCFRTLETRRAYAIEAGFEELEHFHRPPGKPLSQQPWLATVWRRPGRG